MQSTASFPDSTAPAAASWLLQTRRSGRVAVAAAMDDPDTFCLLENEDLDDPLCGFLPRLPLAGHTVLDWAPRAGALPLALALGGSAERVIAFETDRARQARLGDSVLANRVAHRLAIADWSPSTPSGQGLQAAAPFDGFLERHPGLGTIALIRLGGLDSLDAVASSPALLERDAPMLAIDVDPDTPASAPIPAALAGFCERHGYHLHRLLPLLGVLVPAAALVEIDRHQTWFALPTAWLERLGEAGIVVPLARGWDDARPPTERSDAELSNAWRGLAGAAAPDGPSALVCSLGEIHSTLLQRLAQRQRDDLPALSLTVHVMAACGRTHSALHLARQMLQHWPLSLPEGLDLHTGAMPPADGWNQLETGGWTSPSSAQALQRGLGEFCERMRASTSARWPADPWTLRQLLRRPGHALDIERRYALGEFRQDRLPDLRLLDGLRSPDGLNAGLWQAVVQSMWND